MNEEKSVIIVGTGREAQYTAKMIRFDKKILCFVDVNSEGNDAVNLIGGGGNIPVEPLEKIKSYYKEGVLIIVAVTPPYEPVVAKLADIFGQHMQYTHYGDLYGYQYKCKSRMIMDRQIPEKNNVRGQQVKNSWMNHMRGKVYLNPAKKACIKDGMKVLDIGCGCGTDLFWWLLQGFDAYGIDCEEWKLAFCKQKIDDFNFPQEWKEHFIFGYGEKLPFQDESLDIVSSWYVLEHVTDWKVCIQEMLRVLKPGGAIFLNAPDYRNSYEEHYLIDIGKSIVDNLEEFREQLLDEHADMTIFDTLNFITKPEVLAEFKNSPYQLEIYDEEIEYPRVVRENGKLKFRHYISLVVKKI